MSLCKLGIIFSLYIYYLYLENSSRSGRCHLWLHPWMRVNQEDQMVSMMSPPIEVKDILVADLAKVSVGDSGAPFVLT